MTRRRTRNKRNRPRRKKEVNGGPSKPSRTQSKDDYWNQIGKRVDTSYDVLGHPQAANPPRVREGTHYTVLAYTDWADHFIPTLIKWNHGAVDNLTDLEISRKNLEKSYLYQAKPKDPERGPDSLVFEVSRKPHPQKTHLESRIRSMGKIVKYDDVGIMVEPYPGKAKELEKYMKLYLTNQKVKWSQSKNQEKPFVKHMFDRHDVPYYGIYDPAQDKWLHEGGDWSDPYPENGRLYYAINENLADQKLQTIKEKK